MQMMMQKKNMNVYITKTSKQMIGNISTRITELQEIKVLSSND